MAIVFVKVDKPAGVKTDEHRALHTRTDIELGQKGRRKTAEGSPSAELLQCFTTYLESGDAEPESFQSADEMLTRILRENAGTTPFASTADMPLLPEEAGLRNSPVDMLRSSGSGSTSGLDSHGGQVLRAYERGIYLFENQLRDALKRFNGYECKEPEPGKFTLAFSCLEDAIMWGTTLQEELLYLDWPEELLALDECAAVHTVNMAARPTRAPDATSPNTAQGDEVSPDADVSSGNVQSALSACMEQWKNAGQQRQLVQRGLKVQMGCAYGRVASRKPLNTGRADYFGNLPNTAARVMSLAKPGQFLIEGSAPMPTELFTSRGGSRHSVDSAGAFSISIGSSMHGKAVAPPLNVSATSNLSEDKATGEFRRTAQLKQFGYFLLKGLDEPKLMLQASTPLLSNRTFVASNRVDPTSVGNTSHRGTNAFKLFSGKGGETKRPSGAELMVERSLVTPRQLSNLSMGRLPSVGSQGSASSGNGVSFSSGGNPYGRRPNPNIYSQFVERQQQERRASRRAYSMTGSNAFSGGKALARRSNSGVLASVPSVPPSAASGGSGHVSFGGSRQGSGQYVLQLGKQAKPHPSLTSSVPTSSGFRSRGGEGATVLPISNDGVARRVAKPMKRATLTEQTMPSRKAGADWV